MRIDRNTSTPLSAPADATFQEYVAKLLAQENLTVEHNPQARTAYFDPAKRVLTLPVFANSTTPMNYLFIGHEVGHALFTDQDALVPASGKIRTGEKTVWNICEDARIEKLIKRRYAGLRVSFNQGYKDIAARDFFGIADKTPAEMPFIERLNLYTKIGSLIALPFSAEEMALVREVEQAETAQDTYEVTRKVADFIKSQPQPEQEQPQEQPQAGEPQPGEGGEGEPQSGDAKGEGDAPTKGDGAGAGEQEAPKGDKPAEAGSSNKGGNTPGERTDAADTEIESETQKALDAAREAHTNPKGAEIVYGNVPEVSLTDITRSYKELLKSGPYSLHASKPEILAASRKFKADNEKTVAHLLKEFEMRKRGMQSLHATTGKTGRLDINKLYSYRYNEDVFLRRKSVPTGKNHGLLMLIDFSTSMAERRGGKTSISNSLWQMLNLVLFCHKAGLPFEIYGFTNGYTYGHQRESANKVEKTGDLQIMGVELTQLFSWKMSTAEFNEMIGIMAMTISKNAARKVFAMGGTPLLETLLISMDLIQRMQKEARVEKMNLILLTDGEGSAMPGNVIGRDSYRRRVVIRDPRTRMEVSLEDYNYRAQEAAILRMIKVRTGATISNFYFTSYLGGLIWEMGKESKMDLAALQNEWNKNEAVVLNNVAGYDKWFAMTGFTKGERISKSDSFATREELEAAAIRMSSNKRKNRLVLTEFAKMIS